MRIFRSLDQPPTPQPPTGWRDCSHTTIMVPLMDINSICFDSHEEQRRRREIPRILLGNFAMDHRQKRKRVASTLGNLIICMDEGIMARLARGISRRPFKRI